MRCAKSGNFIRECHVKSVYERIPMKQDGRYCVQGGLF